MATIKSRLGLLNQMAVKFGPQVASLFNQPYFAPTDIRVDSTPEGGAASGAYHGDIVFDREWLKNANRKDIRGALIHEITHVQGLGATEGYGARGEETYADLARAALNPHEVKGWSPTQTVLDLAEKKGIDVGAYDNNGPKAGKGNRQRNALTNGRGGAVPPPPVSPGQAVDYAGQTANATQTLYAKLAALQAQAGVVKSQFKMDRVAVRQQRVAGQVAAEADASARGGLGSSADLTARAGVDAAASSGLQQALQTKIQGILGIKTERIGAANDYYTQLYQIQAQKAAAQMQAAQDAFLNDLVTRLGDESAVDKSNNGGNGPGGNGQTAAQRAQNPTSGGVGQGGKGVSGLAGMTNPNTGHTFPDNYSTSASLRHLFGGAY